jgi:DNA-binding CsgD family transcriptional regulator
MRDSLPDAQARGEGLVVTISEFVAGTLWNALRFHDKALAATSPAENVHEEGVAIWALTELVESAVLSGRPERARRPFELVRETTSAAGTDWALGIEARLRALVNDGDDVEPLYQEAIARLDRTRVRVQYARTHLLYGEWLQRNGRRHDARVELRTAHQLFSEFGAEAFADRARVGLASVGEKAPLRRVSGLDELTPQEAKIARLAAEGQTNREISARLFVSTSTVEYHLHKAFRKLQVKSRAQLAGRLS